MYTIHDEDEWKVVTQHRECTACRGDYRKCNGQCNGMSSFALVRRDAAEVREIKAKRQREREDKILTEADLIRARRQTPMTRGG